MKYFPRTPRPWRAPKQENEVADHRLGMVSDFVSICFLCNLSTTSEFSDSLLLYAIS
jgi:hypothetical protein